MVTRIDLRVHAAAPSSRKDDDQAKAQAEAYAAFQPATRTVLLQAPQPISSETTFGRHDQAEDVADGPDGDVRQAGDYAQLSKARDETTVPEWDPTIFLDETQLGFTALESQLITSSLRVSKTPYKPPAGEFELASGDGGQGLRSSSEAPLSSKRKEVATAETPRPGSTDSDRPTKKSRVTDAASSSDHPEPDFAQSVLSARRHATSSNGSSAAVEPKQLTSPDQSVSQSSYLVSPELGRPKDRARPSYDAYLRSKAHKILLPTFRAIQENSRPAAAFVRTEPHNRGHDLSAARDQERSHSASVDDATSELPTSYSLSDITSGSSRSKQQSSLQRSASDPGPASHVLGTSAVPARSASLEADEAVVNVTPDDLDQAERRKQSSPVLVRDFASPAPPPMAAPAKVATPSVARAVSISPDDLPTEIRPPLPEVSLQSFESHVTPALDYLATSEALSGAYKPVFATRELRKTERGHWSFDITTWTSQLRREFFDFMLKTIGEGKAGWGVWCSHGDEDNGPHVVKVFGWGEIVRHVYLMLYVASKSKVRKLGLRWIDAEGKIVVQMRSTADAA